MCLFLLLLLTPKDKKGLLWAHPLEPSRGTREIKRRRATCGVAIRSSISKRHEERIPENLRKNPLDGRKWIEIAAIPCHPNFDKLFSRGNVRMIRIQLPQHQHFYTNQNFRAHTFNVCWHSVVQEITGGSELHIIGIEPCALRLGEFSN